jgi:serine/threonine protein kinase/tetratricopeptide (TPR) repeat protein
MTANEAPPPPPPAASILLERGQTIDRFVVIGIVGRGGMGEVYAAYDPELDRKVAIKLLRTHGGTADGRQRLLREAQAIAKLSDPNVVVVYDVGTFGESVFIAMEFVEGHTLEGWRQTGQRTKREIMQVFLAAGRGLAAAHAAGLVHRDFKPDNVMVTKDGQVRVMDFGLARSASEKAETAATIEAARAVVAQAVAAEPPPDIDPDATMNLGPGGQNGRSVTTTNGSSYLSVKLTQTGAMLGTPAYMSPEQFAVRPTDARTDQFSLCVALYEHLYGQRPFEGESFAALMKSVTKGVVRPAPTGSRVPGWVRKVLLRGLSVDPARRYPSMNALLAALEKDPTVRVKRLAAGVGVLVLVVAAAAGARRTSAPQEPVCRGGGERWAGVWETGGAASARKDAIRKAFVATGRSYAEQAYTGAARLLDDYAGKWQAMYLDACEDTHVRGEQSAEVLDLRMSCLQERLTNVSALSEVFAHADGTIVENAVSAAGALPLVDRCADVAVLKAVVKPPENEAVRQRVESLRAELAHLIALRDAGHCGEAETLAQGLIPRVRAAGYAPLLAETLGAAGYLSNDCLDLETGGPRFKEAVTAGIASGHDEAATAAAALLGGLLADRQGKLEAAEDWLSVARATLARMGGKHPRLEGWLRDSEAIVLQRAGNAVEAVAAHAAAGEILATALGRDHPDALISLMNTGSASLSAGRYAEALESSSLASRKFGAILGAEHPKIALSMNNEGEALNALGRHGEALDAFRRTMEIWRKAGADRMFMAYGLTGQGIALVGLGRNAEAIPPLEEALRTRIETHSDGEHLGETRFALARALWSRPADRPRARTLALSARSDLRNAAGAPAQRTASEIEAWLAANR